MAGVGVAKLLEISSSVYSYVPNFNPYHHGRREYWSRTVAVACAYESKSCRYVDDVGGRQGDAEMSLQAQSTSYPQPTTHFSYRYSESQSRDNGINLFKSNVFSMMEVGYLLLGTIGRPNRTV